MIPAAPAAVAEDPSARRILVLVPWLVMGGADKFNLDLVEQLVGRGWDVTIATTRAADDGWLSHFERCTSNIYRLPVLLKPTEYPSFLSDLIRTHHVGTVLVTNSEFGYRVLPYLRAQYPDVIFVDFCHSEREDWNDGGYPRYAVDNQEFLDLTIVSSAHLKRWMVDRGAQAERIEVSYTNIDPELWRPSAGDRRAVREELGLRQDVPAILYASRLSPEKLPRIFAQTVHRLLEAGHDFVALAAGDGPDLPWLKAFVEERELQDRLRLLGGTSLDRMRRVMAAADILFLPTEWEGISLAIFEAMACGLPIVSADVGGQAELVTPDCGVLLPRVPAEQAIDGYAAALARLLAEPGLRRSMGNAARARVSTQFTLDQMGRRMTELLEHAGRLHRVDPRPVPSAAVARALANQAVTIEQLLDYSKQLEQARDWYRDQRVTDQRSAEEARDWYRDQRDAWQRAAEECQAAAAKAAEELVEYGKRLEHARDWYRDQRDAWQRTAEECQAAATAAALDRARERAAWPGHLARAVVAGLVKPTLTWLGQRGRRAD